MDVAEDRQHPVKKDRPIASGKVSKGQAYGLSFLLMLLSLWFASFYSMPLFWMIILYVGINIAYSLKLKHVPVLDIFIIALGFVLRIYVGGAVTDIPLSKWIVIITFLLALFLALAKRRDDVLLNMQGKKTRKNIKGYNLEFVSAGMVLMAGVIIIAYIMYSIAQEIVLKFDADNLYLTSFFVVLGLMRYMQITFVEEKSGNPTKIIYSDRFLQTVILCWLISFFVVVHY